MSKKIDLSTAILDTRIANSLIVKGEDEVDIKLHQHEILINISKAAELDIYSDGPVRVKGKKQKSTILTARIDENLDEHIVIIPKMTRKNLCIRINDTVKLYEVEIENIQEAHGVSMYPIKDTIEGIKGEIYKLFIYPYFKSIPICFVSKDCIYKIKAGITTIECKVVKLVANVNGETVDVDHARVVQDTEVDSTGEVERSSIERDYGLIGYDDIGGCRRQMAQIRECIELPLKQPELFSRIGIKPPRGILLHGPPGTGKTLIAKAIANETGAYLHVINGPEIMSKMSGESESNLRKAFETAAQNAPAIIFMDEIDSIAPNREKSSQEAEKRIVSQLLTLMDGMSERSNVIVLGATNRPNSIDPALRRFGRFDREIEIGVPDALGRLEVLGIHTKNMNLADDVDLEAIAKEVHGFTGSDLASLCSEAAIQQIREKLPLIDLDKEKIDAEILNSLKINNDNFRYAIANTDPSSLRETVIETPNIKWSDIGGLEMVKRELRETVQYPVNHPEKYLKFGQNPSKGVLLYGPPGCGKTLLAKAVATECNANFISIKGPELLTKWVGESESNVRNLFDKARGSAPCVLFFDEIDSIGKSRLSASNDGGTTDRVLNQLLAEMDGMNQKKNVFVMGATNRPGQLDSALMRPGRLDQLVYIPLPDEKSRLSILEAKLKKAPIDPQVNLRDIADQTDGFSGADMAEICQRAAKLAIRESIEAELRDPDLKDDPVPYLTKQHFKDALKNARRSVTKQEIEGFEQFARSMNVELKGDSHDPEDDDLYD